jgi:tetratricopeptide (TPR) repeat protein
MHPALARAAERGLPIAVLGLAAALYARSLAGDWVWDDVHQYRDNPAITRPGVLVTRDVWGPTGQADPHDAPIYRPLAMVTHAPGQMLLRGPAVERAQNLLLFLAAVWGVASLSLRLGAGRRAAWFGAACLAWHPASTEAVAWISSRGDLLGSALVLGGVIAFVARRDPLAGCLVALAPFCKETFVLAPLALAVWMLALRRLSIPALALSFAGVGAYFAVRGALGIPLPGGAGIASAGDALGAVGAVAARALELLVLPRAPDALAPFHSRPLLGALALALALPAFAFLPGRPWLAALLAPLPFLALAAPASLGNGVVSDRYFYAAAVQLAVAAALGMRALEARTRLAPALFVVPLALAPFTALRAVEWMDNERLFGVALRRHPDDAEAQFKVAYDRHVRGDCESAIPLYARASERSLRAGNNLQACLLRLGRAVEAARIGPELAERDPANATPALNTARALALQGDLAGAERWAREAARRRPDRAGSHALLGQILGTQGRHQEALQSFEHALVLAPGDASARQGLEVARRALAPATAAP